MSAREVTHSLQAAHSLWTRAGQTCRMTRRLPVLLCFVAVVVVPPSAGAQDPRLLEGEGGSLALENGRGTAIVVSRDGALIGPRAVAHGRIVVVDLLRGERTSVQLWGCERRRRYRRTVICSGRDLSLSVLEGRWRARLEGSGINASAKVEGAVTLKGTRGTFRLGDEAEPRRWPRLARTFVLG